jgi:hypothetical protein
MVFNMCKKATAGNRKIKPCKTFVYRRGIVSRDGLNNLGLIISRNKIKLAGT